MGHVLEAIGRRLSKYLVSFFLIVIIVATGKTILSEVKTFNRIVSDLETVGGVINEINQFNTALQTQTGQINIGSLNAIEVRLRTVDEQLRQRQEEREQSRSSWPFDIPSISTAKLDAEIRLLQVERDYLEGAGGLISGRDGLEVLRLQHVAIYKRLQGNLVTCLALFGPVET